MGTASHLLQGGFTFDKVGEARQLFAGATSFFRGLTHQEQETDAYGLGTQDFAQESPRPRHKEPRSLPRAPRN